MRSVPPDALLPAVPVVVVFELLLLPPPPHPAATKARHRTAASPRGQANLGFPIVASSASLVSSVSDWLVYLIDRTIKR
jgi:hypothetical protein